MDNFSLIPAVQHSDPLPVEDFTFGFEPVNAGHSNEWRYVPVRRFSHTGNLTLKRGM